MATITIAELATTLDTDARTARKFMRAITPREQHPGKGSRWAIEARQVAPLKRKFAKFAAELEAKRASREGVADAPEGDAPEEG